MVCKDTMRSRILEAAKKRFAHFGFGKTTMAEVAADLNMSPGNLYRYFQGKIDIALEISRDAWEREMTALREVVRQPGLTSYERLRTFLFRDLQETFKMIAHDPRVFELAELIKKERPHHINEMLAQQRSLLVEILSQGNASGEFDIPDVVLTCEMLQSATMKFRFPQLWSALPLDRLEMELDGVLKLIIDGLAGGKGTARQTVRHTQANYQPAA